MYQSVGISTRHDTTKDVHNIDRYFTISSLGLAVTQSLYINYLQAAIQLHSRVRSQKNNIMFVGQHDHDGYSCQRQPPN